MAAKISCHWLPMVISVILTAHTLCGLCIHIQTMSGRLSLGEALECILNDNYSSGEESNTTEDPQFPLPVAFSNNESFTLPVIPCAGSSMPPFVTTVAINSTASTGTTSMSTAATVSPPLSSSGRAAALSGKTLSMQN